MASDSYDLWSIIIMIAGLIISGISALGIMLVRNQLAVSKDAFLLEMDKVIYDRKSKFEELIDKESSLTKEDIKRKICIVKYDYLNAYERLALAILYKHVNKETRRVYYPDFKSIVEDKNFSREFLSDTKYPLIKKFYDQGADFNWFKRAGKFIHRIILASGT